MRNFTRFFKSKFEVVFPRLSQKQQNLNIRERGGDGKCQLVNGIFKNPVNSILLKRKKAKKCKK
jgi:hypothetical protein